ncbi:MAG: hypothetical protein IJ789_07725 [Bacteroidales bacterium]|nr:hypothetical protein [Bacteroidales bacterium]
MIQQNSAALREALNRFFTAALDRDDIDIKIEVGGGWKMASMSFITKGNNDFLYVDLDRPPELRQEWFNQKLFNGKPFPQSKSECVFFWVQEMEAWFLKQPECIVRWAKQERLTIKSADLEDDQLIKDKDIEHLKQKPSFVMSVLFKRHLESNKTDKNENPKKVAYGKLRHAPGIIQALDPIRMIHQDKELSNFVEKVRSMG